MSCTFSSGFVVALTLPPAPIVTTISPNSVEKDYSDTLVLITGENFVATPSVKIGTYDCTGESFVSSTQITATVPAGIPSGTYDVIVTNSDAQSGSLNNGFTAKSGVVTETTCSALNGWQWLNGACWSNAIADGVSWNKGVGNNTGLTGAYTCNGEGTLQSRMEAAVAGRWSEIVTEVNGISISSVYDGVAGKSFISALAIADCVDGIRNIGPVISGNDIISRNNTLDTWARMSGHSALPAVKFSALPATKYDFLNNEYAVACIESGVSQWWNNCSWLAPCSNGVNACWAAATNPFANQWDDSALVLGCAGDFGRTTCWNAAVFYTTRGLSDVGADATFRIVVRP